LARNNSSCRPHIRSLDLGLSTRLRPVAEDALDHTSCCMAAAGRPAVFHDRPVMERVYALAEQALARQQEIPLHVFPFRMTTDKSSAAFKQPMARVSNNLKGL